MSVREHLRRGIVIIVLSKEGVTIYSYPMGLDEETISLYSALIGTLCAIASEIFKETHHIKMEIGEAELLLRMGSDFVLAIFKNKSIPDNSINIIVPDI